mgnify:CR=1 FL=1
MPELASSARSPGFPPRTPLVLDQPHPPTLREWELMIDLVDCRAHSLDGNRLAESLHLTPMTADLYTACARAEFGRMLRMGLSVEDAAQEFGVSADSVRRLLAKGEE